MKSTLAAMLLATVAACDQAGPDNVAADANGQHMMDNGMMNDAMMDNSMMVEPPNGAETATPPEATDEPAAVKIAPVPPKAAPKAAPKPKAVPKPKTEPPVDPHAGHDMNKM